MKINILHVEMNDMTKFKFSRSPNLPLPSSTGLFSELFLASYLKQLAEFLPPF